MKNLRNRTEGSAEGSKWATPALSIGIGIAYLIGATIGGDVMLGLAMFGVMIVFAAVLLLGERNDVIQVLRGQPADERYKSFENRATVIAGNITAVFVIAMFVYELARSGDIAPYATVAAVFGGSFIVALIWLRYRG